MFFLSTYKININDESQKLKSITLMFIKHFKITDKSIQIKTNAT